MMITNIITAVVNNYSLTVHCVPGTVPDTLITLPHLIIEMCGLAPFYRWGKGNSEKLVWQYLRLNPDTQDQTSFH